MSAFPGGTFTWTGGQGGQSGVTVTGNNNNVNVGSGNQQASTGGGNTAVNNNNASNNADADKPQFSQDIFDYVELKLQYFADKTKYIADKITDYVTTATKGTLLGREITAIQDEIKANSQAATTYANFAEQLATAYAYADKDGNKQTINIWSKFKKNELLNGAYRLDQINTTNPADAAMVEGARAYLDYINKARDANNAIQELTNTMRDLQSQIIQLPTEKLEKSLEKFENQIKSINGITSAIEGGKSGIASAQRYVNSVTNYNANMKKYIDAEKKSATSRKNTYKNYTNKKNTLDTKKKDLKAYIAKHISDRNERNKLYGKIDSGKSIATSKNTGKEFKKYIDAYNKALQARNTARSTFETAKNKNEADKKAKSDMSIAIASQANTLMEAPSAESYVTQNNMLDKEMTRLKQELDKRKAAMKEQAKVTTDFADQQNKLRNKINSITTTDAYKTASKADKKIIDDAIKNNHKIDATKISNGASNKLAEAVANYNKMRQSLESVTSALNQAKEQEAKMKEELIQSAVEAAEREQKIAQEKMDNIESWYQQAIELSKTWATKRETLRKLWKERGYYINENEITQPQLTFGDNNDSEKRRMAYSRDLGYYIAKKVGTDKDGNDIFAKDDSMARGKLITDGISYTYDKLGTPVIQENSPIAHLKDNYEGQIKQLQDMQKSYKKQADEQQELLKKYVNNGTIVNGSEEYKSMVVGIQEARIEVLKLDSQINELYDDMRENVYFKPLENMIKNLDALRKGLDQIKGTISQEMMYTTDGTFTELGTAKYAMDIRGYKLLQDQFTKIRTAQQLLTNRMGQESYLDLETYNNKMKEYEAQARDVITSLASQRQTIIKDVTDRYQTEITYINKLIDAKKNELNKRKELYDYDKKLRKQNKDVQLIEQQIRALNGLGDAESKAAKARLEAQRAEMQEELDDTVKEHIVNLRIDGLTDLSTKLQENYEKYVKDVAINVNHAVDLVSNSADNLSKVLDNVNSSFNAYLKSFHPDAFYGEFVLGVPKMIEEDTKIMTEWVKGVNLPDNEIGKTLKDYEDNLSEKEYKYWDAMTSEAAKISAQVGDLNNALNDLLHSNLIKNGDFSGGKLGEEYISGGLASGTKSAKPGLYQINEKGPEAIITRRGVMLMPLRAGDGVIPADLTENLMAMAKSGMVPVQTPNFQAPEYNVSQNTNQNVTIHYDSLIRVDGNMDQTVVPQIEEIAKGLISNNAFKKNIYNYTTREMGKDMRKAGH